MPYHSDLDKALKQLDRSCNAFLLISKDRVRIQYLERRLLEFLQVDPKARGGLFFGESLTPKEITILRDTFYSTDMFSPQQVIRVLKADQIKSAALDAFLDTPPNGETSNFLLLHAEQLKSNSRLRKYFKQRKALLELKPIPEKEMSAWTISHASSMEMELSGKVAELITAIGEQQADSIDQILKQLKLFCDEGSAPKTSDVLQLFHYHPDPNEFLLLGKILVGPAHEAERMIHELLEAGKNAFLLLNLLGKSVSRLLLIRNLMTQRVPQQQIAQRVGVSPWLFDKDLKLVKQAPKRKIEALHVAVMKADSQLKGKSLGPEIIFSQLIHSV